MQIQVILPVTNAECVWGAIGVFLWLKQVYKGFSLYMDGQCQGVVHGWWNGEPDCSFLALVDLGVVSGLVASTHGARLVRVAHLAYAEAGAPQTTFLLAVQREREYVTIRADGTPVDG